MAKFQRDSTKPQTKTLYKSLEHGFQTLRLVYLQRQTFSRTDMSRDDTSLSQTSLYWPVVNAFIDTKWRNYSKLHETQEGYVLSPTNFIEQWIQIIFLIDYFQSIIIQQNTYNLHHRINRNFLLLNLCILDTKSYTNQLFLAFLDAYCISLPLRQPFLTSTG